MNPELEAYYNYLKGAGADVPESLKDFQYNLQDEVSAQSYYDYLKKNKFDTPETFEDFAYTLGVKKKATSLAPGVNGPEEHVPFSPESFQQVQASPEQLITSVPDQLQSQITGQAGGAPPTVLPSESESWSDAFKPPMSSDAQEIKQVLPDDTEPPPTVIQQSSNPGSAWESETRRPDILESLVQTIASGLADQLPKEYLTQKLRMSKGSFGDLFDPRSNLSQVSSLPKEIDQDEFNQWNNKLNSEDRSKSYDDKAELFLTEKLGREGYNALRDQFQKQNLEQRIGIEKDIQQQNKEAAFQTQGIVQDLKEVHGASDFLSFAGNMMGQALYRAPVSITSGSTGSIIAESAAVYDRQLDLIAQDKGITREEVIKQGLDKPAEGQALAVALGVIDAVSAGSLIGLFRKAATKELTKGAVTEFAKGFAKGAATEGITEAIQTEGEEFAASKGAGVEYKPDAWRIATAAVGGAIGGGALSGITTAAPIEKPEQTVTTTEGDSGKPPANETNPEAAPKKEPVEVPRQPVKGATPTPVGTSAKTTKVPATPVAGTTEGEQPKKQEDVSVVRTPSLKEIADTEFGKEHIVISKISKEEKNITPGQVIAHPFEDQEAKDFVVVLKQARELDYKKDKEAWQSVMAGQVDAEGLMTGRYPNGKRINKQDVLSRLVAHTEVLNQFIEKNKGNGASDTEIGTPEDAVTQQISDLIGKEKLDKRAIEKIGADNGIEDKNQVKELAELAVVQKARELAKTDDFEGLVKLYEDQPNLTHRTSESVRKQQYSTPAPMAYSIGKYIGADQKGKKVFEPSAGNGMLTIVGNPDTYTVNEIDETRLKNLNTQGFGEVLTQDGSKDFKRDKQYDAVVTNPPFGGTQAQEISGYKMNELAQIMAIKGLDAMKDNGRAGIIIGGNNEFDDKGRMKGRDRIFFNYLFSHYNVDDVIDVAGDLYRKQGASFPIRVILVNGRKAKPDGATPLKDFFGEQESDFEGINNRIQKFISNENIQSAELESGATDVIPGGGAGLSEQSEQGAVNPTPGEEVSESGGKGKRKPKPAATDSGPVGDQRTEQRPQVDSGVNPDERVLPQTPVREGLEESIPEQQQSEGTEGNVREQQPRSDRKVAEGAISGSTVAYKPLSKASSLDLKTPAGMAQELLDAQTQLENEVGDIDDFVMDRLKYDSKEQMYEALSAEQIDGVALAIRNIERGTGIIIGDATGIGKGRQAAAIIRYANKQGGPAPIFMSEKPGLFSDIWRDLVAIGSGDMKPFIVNTYSSGHFESIVDTETGIEYHKAPASNSKEWQAAIDKGEAPKGTNVILSTYSQFSNPKIAWKKINFLISASRGSIVIMDEAHNASGAGNTGQLFQEILPETKGVVYLSGTFAKRADNMPLYATKTSMNEANMSSDSMVDAVARGGIALQEIISSQLVDSGEMIRRQRSFEGVEVRNHMLGGDDQEQQKRHQQAADHVTELMRDIILFQKEHVKPVVERMDREVAKEGKAMTLRGGTNMAGVDNQPYFSKVFNVINQLLYSIKSKDTAKLVIEELKAGKKPFVAIRSTMEAMLTDLMDRGQMEIGDVIDADFRFILRKGLEGVLRISEKDAMGNSVKKVIPQGELGMDGQKEYGRILSKIGKLTTGLSISPIDELVEEVKKAGYTIGEVTGRKLKLKFLEGGKAMIEARKKEPTNKMYQKYNSGDFDVIVVNSSGSTGASAQSSPKFKDQRQRHMIVLEPELNISTLVQLLGRVNRTGQISLPMYTFVTSSIPAEQRLMMMTMRKLKSLDANTTSNQKQSKGILEVPEIFNKYGDRVVIEYLQENPEVVLETGDPLDMVGSEGFEPAKDKVEGAANKVSGRVAILPTAEQNKFYNEVTERYVKQIEFLNEAGMNDLEVKQLPLNAKSIEKQVKILGKGGRSKFGTDTYLENLEVDVLKKPLTKVEIDQQIQELTGGDEEITKKYVEGTEAAFDKQQADIIAADEKSTAIRVESIRGSQKLSETEKEERISDILKNDSERQQGKITRESFKVRKLVSYFQFFKPGRAVKVAGDLSNLANNVTYTDAVFMGYDINMNKPKPFLPSNITLKFALNDSRRMLSILASKTEILDNIRANSYSLSEEFQNNVGNKWDDLKKPKGRTRRYFVTGNILQGLGNIAFRGPIVKYTTQDGFIDTGIMLPESFDPKEEGVAKNISVPARKATSIMTGSPVGTVFTSSDNIWTIKKDTNQRYELRVPKSKAVGGKYFLDEDIGDLVDRNIWDSSGQSMVATTDSTRLAALLDLLTNKFGTAFEVDAKEVDKAIKNQEVDFSKRSGNTFENFNAAMSAPFPVIGKVKKTPQNTELLEKLRKAIKFPEKQEKAFTEAGAPVDQKPNALLADVKEFLVGFTQHFKHISEKAFPRETNLLRTLESAKKYTTTRAMTYIKGLVEPLTPEQFDIMRRKIILEDLLHGIDRGEINEGLDGKFPFEFESKEQIKQELEKESDLAESDSITTDAYEARTAYQKNLETLLTQAGLLSEQDREFYYHRRILAYQYDDFDQSVIHGRHLGKKTRNWQLQRKGTRGLDYSTNFIETEYKVVAEALYELEKQRILKEVMSPYEAQMKRLKKEFNLEFQHSIEELEQQFGENSEEVDIRRKAKRSLMHNYIEEHLPEGYIAWQPDEGNALFYKKNVGERRIEGAMEEAMNADMTGMGYATAIVQSMMGDMEENLMMGGPRKQYMIPEELAKQLDYMGKTQEVGAMMKMVQETTAVWKLYILLNPNRFVKYNLNNFFGDIDGALAADPTIVPKLGQAWKEVKRYKQTGETTDTMMEALREGVIDSGWEISELNALSDEQWVKFFMSDDNGPDIQDAFGKKVYKSLGENFVERPKNMLKGYFDWAKKWTGIRENTLRYAAYLRAKEKTANGETFYWASNQDAIDAIKDPVQKSAKLAREAIGDYGNISVSGQQLRKAMIPFYSFLEINMRRYYRLFRNAGSPAVQKAILASGIRRGIPAIAIRMIYSYAMIALFTALVQAWNYLMFPEEAEKLRRTNVRGMQFILSVNKEGKVISIPIVGALYDFVDTFGIPDMADAFAMMFSGTAPTQAAGEAAKTFGWSIANKGFQQATPLAKYPAEALTGLQFFPDAANPRPIHNYGEWAAGIVSLQDEYRAASGIPTKEPYFPGHIRKMFLNELDPEELAYYQARRIVEEWAGKTIRMEPENPEAQARKDALYKFGLSLRYGKDDEATMHIQDYRLNGGTQSVKQILKAKNPFNGLKEEDRQDLFNKLKDPTYTPQSAFVKNLTPKELAIMRDARAYFLRLL